MDTVIGQLTRWGLRLPALVNFVIIEESQNILAV